MVELDLACAFLLRAWRPAPWFRRVSQLAREPLERLWILTEYQSPQNHSGSSSPIRYPSRPVCGFRRQPL